MMRIRFVTWLTLMLIGVTALADAVQFKMSAPSIVTTGEQFSLTLTLNENGSNLRVPALPNFKVLMGPSTSSSRSFSSVNGRMTQSVEYSYTYVLRAEKEGTYPISPASVQVGKKVYQSNALTIKVITGQKPQSENEDMFIRFETDKRTVYKGEALIATLKLYSRVSLSLADQKMPSFEGFWTQDIELPQAAQTQTREDYNGVIYNVYTLNKKVLIPQQSGQLSIEPAEMTLNVQQRVRSNNPFDDFFGSTRNIQTNVSTKRIPITVKDLPPAPGGFNGAVGKFSISSSIDKTNIKANEAITIRSSITGSGNLKHINPIAFDFPPDFEIYDPKTTYNYKTSAAGLSGSTSFEQLVIPRYAGDFVIPAQKFVYFDPQANAFKTLFTNEFNIHVEKGDEDQNTTVVSSMSKEDVKFLGKDVQFIKQGEYPLMAINGGFFGSLGYYLSYAIALFVFIVLVVLQRKRLKNNADLARMRNKKASRMARKHLKYAGICVKQNDKDHFFDALLKAFWGYLSDKLTIPMSELNRDTAKTTLNEYSVDEATIDEFIEVVDICEMAKFAPSAVNEEISELYKRGEKLIGKFERQVRKKA